MTTTASISLLFRIALTAALLAAGISAGSGADRAVDLRPMMTPVKHQGQRNTCNVFAATALMEYLIKQKTGRDEDLSESYNYWAARKYTLNTAFLRESYQHIDGLAGFLAVEVYRRGCADERDWPYEERNWQQMKDPRCTEKEGKPSMECFTGTPPGTLKVRPTGMKPVYIDRHKIGAFILKQRKPVVFNIMWCGEAVNQKTGEFRMPTDAEIEKSGTGHVILLAGYDPAGRRFIYRNSWGETWGNRGYGTIPEEYIVRHCEVCRNIPFLKKYPPEAQKFILQGSMGVSGELVDIKRAR